MSNETLPFDPSRLLNHVMERLKLKNDAALSRALEVAPPVISKIRHQRLAIGPALKIRILEKMEISVHEINYLIGKAAA
jgi:plasmid maintenance system antidote protein VapI